MEEKEKPTFDLRYETQRAIDASLKHVSREMLRRRLKNARNSLKQTNERLANSDTDNATLIEGLLKRRRLITSMIGGATNALARKIELETGNENSD